MTTPKLQLPETANGQANYLLVNSALATLDQLVMPRVVDKDLSTPPGSPANGALYIVGASPTGAWAGKANNLAWWLTAVGAWTFLAPAVGMAVRVLDEIDSSNLPLIYGYTGAAWAQQNNGGGAPVGRTISGTSGTLVPADAGNIVLCTSGSAVSLSIQIESSGAWPAAAVVTVLQLGAGTVTITDGGGITVNVFSGLTKSLRGQYASASLIRSAADTFALAGMLGGTPA